jgi:hypothetical protein
MKSDKVKIQIHVKRLPCRNDAMFYYGKHIATLTKGTRKIFIESAGEMQASFKENGVCYKNEMLAKELRTRKITDSKLSDFWEDGKIKLNNWFRIYDELKDSEVGIAGTYDGAIELAIKRINEA